jgi:hypothetical protein
MLGDGNGYKLEKLLLNNGANLKATVKNIECFDVPKHITGTLQLNLEELVCEVQKGDLRDKMSIHLYEYLSSDVMGLKELSQKLNQSCFESFNIKL